MTDSPLLSASAALTLCRNCGFPLSYQQLAYWNRAGAIHAIADPTRPHFRLYSRTSILDALPGIAHSILLRACRRGDAL
mgnify:CR=1 FL=1